MKNIKEIYETNYECLVKDIKINSKEVTKNDIFVCIKGVNEDRHKYIKEALDNGASFIVTSKAINANIPHIKVKNTNEELPKLAKRMYKYKDTLKLIGITGTDGKTSTANIIRDMLYHNECGYIGTNGIIGKKINLKVDNTTPDSHILYKYLSKFEREKLKYVAMETSSEAFLRKRLSSFTFDIGILTNITEDHLNVHKTLTNYINCKLELFKSIKRDGYAILNKDDVFYDKVRENCKCHILTYGKDLDNDLVIENIEEYLGFLLIKYRLDNKVYDVKLNLNGKFNAYNLAPAILTLYALEVPSDEIFRRIRRVKTIPGRCQLIKNNYNKNVILDYAHTVNSLNNILSFLNRVKQGKIITVTGSAGGREKEKRPLMGKVCQKLSDLVIYTKDDPRYEDPKEIVNEMIDRTKDNYLVEIDRKKAIDKALKIATYNDIVLVAGKGIDKYMLENGKKIIYSDYDYLIKKLTK